MDDIRRIVLVNGSRLMITMLRRVLGKAKRLEVVGECELGDLNLMIQEKNPDWVIINIEQNGKGLTEINKLVQAHPKVRFLLVTTDGSQVQMKWYEAHEEDLNGRSLAEILKLLVEQH